MGVNSALENARSKAIKALRVKIIVCVIIALVFFVAGLGESIPFAFIMLVIGFGIGWWAFTKISKNTAYAEFVSLYKKDMIDNALNGNQIFDEMNYQYNCGINKNIIEESGLFDTDKFFSDCLIQGKHRNVNFVQADVRNVDSSNNGDFVTYEGTFAVIPTYLPDSSQTNISDKKADIAMFLPGKSYKTGNPDFDSAFNVYSDNSAKASQLLTPDIINKLLNIQQTTNCKMAITVKNGLMYIFIKRADSPLKPGLRKKYNEQMKSEIISELSRVKFFIDSFSVIQ